MVKLNTRHQAGFCDQTSASPMTAWPQTSQVRLLQMRLANMWRWTVTRPQWSGWLDQKMKMASRRHSRDRQWPVSPSSRMSDLGRRKMSIVVMFYTVHTTQTHVEYIFHPSLYFILNIQI